MNDDPNLGATDRFGKVHQTTNVFAADASLHPTNGGLNPGFTVVLPASSAGAVAGYGDVAAGRHFTAPVQWSLDNDITGLHNACLFKPDRLVSRGEMAVWLWNMAGKPPADWHSHPFVDVPDGGQALAVSWLVDREITTGTSPTTFSPDNGLTRAQFAAFLWRLAGKPQAPAHSFVDVAASWQQGPVSWLVDRGITTGTSPTTFSPDNGLTRAQLVTFLYRYNNKPTVTIDPNSPSCAPSGTFKTLTLGGAVFRAGFVPTTPSPAGAATTTGRLMRRRARSRPSTSVTSPGAGFVPTTPSPAGAAASTGLSATTGGRLMRRRARSRPSPTAGSLCAGFVPTTPSPAGATTATE